MTFSGLSAYAAMFCLYRAGMAHIEVGFLSGMNVLWLFLSFMLMVVCYVTEPERY